MKCLISLILIACSFVSTGAYANNLDPYSFMTKTGKGKPFPIIIKDKVPGYLKYESGVVYTPGPDTKERELDILYHADHKTVKRPAIVILHGGGWKSGDSTRGHEIMAIYATQGYVTLSINYRLSGTAIAPAAVHDSKLAIRWARANAEKYGVDPDRIGCTGGSAGGHLTAMMAVTDPSDGVEGPHLEEYSSSVKAAMPLSGVYDLRGSDRRFLDPFLGGKYGSRKKGLTDQMSPAVLLRPEKRKTIPPMLIVHSDKEMVPVVQFDQFVAALKKIGRKEKTILLPGKGHGHKLIRVPEVREAADKFFRQHLDPQPPAVEPILMIGFACGRAAAGAGGYLFSNKKIDVHIGGAQPSLPIVERDSDAVVLAHEETVNDGGNTWELDFYRNPAYDCGLSGNYTFLVMNPANDANVQAPLWVYLHGGGVGYFDDLGGYHATGNQTQDTWNHEETFADLWDGEIVRRTVDGNGQPIDNTLSRRIQEGYRLLVVAMCDHDLYYALGTPYPNNPNGGEVNGLQATMAAVDYTVANYPTTHVFAHGTSAGGHGVWGLAAGFAFEGTGLTGVVADSGLTTPRSRLIFAAFSGVPGYPYAADFDLQGVIDKIGVFVDDTFPFYPEAMVSNGFDDVPILFIGGDADRFCAGNQPPIAEAAAAGLNNCDWVRDGIRQAVADQPDSPHQVSIIDGAGHVPTNKPGVANDIVDDFITQILSTNPPYPFRHDPTHAQATRGEKKQ